MGPRQSEPPPNADLTNDTDLAHIAHNTTTPEPLPAYFLPTPCAWVQLICKRPRHRRHKLYITYKAQYQQLPPPVKSAPENC